MSIARAKLVFTAFICGLLFSVSFVHLEYSNAASSNEVVVIHIDEAIGPASKDYFTRSLEKAIDRNARFLIMTLNTPGGLDSSMRDINKAILASRIPIVTYVSPSGARAASAGTYILYASHIAAMAPATNLGAATPVQIGVSPPGINDKNSGEQQQAKEKPSTDNKSTLARKAINDAAAYIRSLAQLRGRNLEWAEKAVREAASLSAKEALKHQVINIIAVDINDLLKQLDGFKVTTQEMEQVIETEGLILEYMEPDWRHRLLSIITNPNIAYLLMMIGIYGLIFEFSNPGAFIPGTVGAICLLLALFAFQTLPINYAGLALIILGIIFMIGEAFVPSFGALGITGVIAFVIGSIILMDTDIPGYGVSAPLIGGFALVGSSLFTLVLVMALKARRRPVVSGQEELIGAIAEAMQDFDNSGFIHLHGESWQAQTQTPIKSGQKVKVVDMDGLVLFVEPVMSERDDNHEEEYHD